MPDKYAVVGNPVAHSKSPLIHAEFARETCEDVSYIAISAADNDFEAVVERFRAEGGRGMNVTLPFKHRAHALAQALSPRAGQALAVNTLTFEAGHVHGDNTDGIGLVRDLTINLGSVLCGARILIMGAGGASYGVCGPLLEERPAELAVANRTRAKAVDLCEHFRALEHVAGVLSGCGYDELAGRRFDLVINATSASLAGQMPALPRGLLAPGALAYDMLYGFSTPFLEFAAGQGAHRADGVGMLVEQAAESFRVWRGIRPQTARVIAMLRQ
jgi:shikimate dehydrogenase